MPSINFHASQLLYIGHGLRDAARKFNAEHGEAAAPPEALASILMAAAATEAFINEFPEHVRIGLTSSVAECRAAVTPAMAGCADVLEELEEAKSSVALKYQLAARMLSGSPFPTGERPFQAFQNLMRIRNEIVHLKPVWSDKTGQLEKLVDALAQQGHALSSEKSSMPPLDRLTDSRASTWACAAARGIILGIVAMTPDSDPTIDPLGSVKRQLGDAFPFAA